MPPTPEKLGFQIIDGPNPHKVVKTGLLYITGFLGTSILFSSELRELANLAVIVGVTYSLHQLGERRRLLSNVTSGAIKISNELLSKVLKEDPERTRKASRRLELNNAFYNVTNGGAYFFDLYAPKELKDAVENVTDQLEKGLRDTEATQRRRR